MLLGHLGFSTVIYRYTKTDFLPLLIGGLFPDIVDKTLCQGLRLTPSGRMYAHTLLAVGLSSWLIRLVLSPKIAWSWALGYLGHLICDSKGFIPWFYPLKQYAFPPTKSSLSKLFWRILHKTKPIEIFLLVWAAVVLLIRER